MTDEQFDKVGHSLGINTYHALLSTREKDKHLPDEFYRNYYCCGKSAEKVFIELEKKGLAKRWTQFDQTYFAITDKGIVLFRDMFAHRITSTYVPESKSKQKYEEYLDADVCDSFSEWLGIVQPRVEYGGYHGPTSGLYRYCSMKYFGVHGDWKPTKKAAKESYKIKLKEYKNDTARLNTVR